jgi:hypothetical protein
MSRSWWATARLLGGFAILAVLVWRLGTGPFQDGVRTLDAWSLVAATGIGVVTTVCCAWRWSLVAGGLGVGVPLGPAVAAYYRSQFLNTTLPGGVLGDVHRAVRHGRDVGDVGGGVRAVVVERLAGQVVLVVLATAVLVPLPSPVRSAMPLVAVLALVALAAAVAWVALRAPALPWAGIVLASAVAVAGYVATFLVAARTVGATASVATLLPLALLVLLAMGVPTNVAGWGPREGMAAWAFGAAGLGADQGVAVAVAYGVLALVASLPGAAVLVMAGRRRGSELPVPQGATHG